MSTARISRPPLHIALVPERRHGRPAGGGRPFQHCLSVRCGRNSNRSVREPQSAGDAGAGVSSGLRRTWAQPRRVGPPVRLLRPAAPRAVPSLARSPIGSTSRRRAWRAGCPAPRASSNWTTAPSCIPRRPTRWRQISDWSWDCPGGLDWAIRRSAHRSWFARTFSTSWYRSARHATLTALPSPLISRSTKPKRRDCVVISGSSACDLLCCPRDGARIVPTGSCLLLAWTLAFGAFAG